MKTSFEKDFEKIRPDLDVDKPNDDLIWSEIRKELKPSVNYKRMFYWSTAAIIVLLLGVGYLIMNLNGLSMKTNKYSLSSISPELGEQQKNYQLIIHTKQKEIRAKKIDNEELEHLFKNLELIDTMEKQFIDDLKKMPNNNRIVNAIIRNYERKIEILERILSESKKKENYGNNIKSINL